MNSGEEDILRVLRELGLSRRESEIYVFLSRNGMQGAAAVSTRLKLERVQTYRALKSLQDKGVVEATLEAPTRFAAVPFDTLLDSLIKTKRTETANLETKKPELVTYWQSLRPRFSDYPIPKFRVLIQQKRIYDEIKHLIDDAKEEVFELTTGVGVIQEDMAGVFDSILNLARKKKELRLRILANISKENMELVEQTMKKISAGKLNVQWRHIDLGSKVFPQFVTKDGEETILYVTRGEKSALESQADTGLSIHSEMFVSALRESFMEIWRGAISAEDRLEELKTGKPAEETRVIRDADEAQAKLTDVLNEAKREVMVITSSDALNILSANNFLRDYSEKGVKFRIMAPIDLDNLAAAQKLSEVYEIRSVPISYLLMITVDDKHLFMFSMPSSGRTLSGSLFHLENMFYTNDRLYVARVGDVLKDIWKRGVDIREMVSREAPETAYPRVTVSDAVTEVIDSMTQSNANSVIVTENKNPVGVITERDLLEKIVKPRKDPDKIRARQIMSIPIFAADSGESLIEATKIMKKTGVRKLAVFRNGRLVGMLTMK